MITFTLLILFLTFIIRIVESSSLSSILVNKLINSPLYGPIISIARNTMIKTAEDAGIEWTSTVLKLKASQNWDGLVADVTKERDDITIPEYYKEKFHGYRDGNLCIDAAVEQEIAAKAVGARNFPGSGSAGEELLRSAYDKQTIKLGAVLEDQGVIVDLGCGTGTGSTSRLANLYPQASKIIGIDLSPHMIAVGRYWQQFGSTMPVAEQSLVDSRVSYIWGDIASTGLEDCSVSLASLCLVLHELPQQAALSTLTEAYRILKPGGSLVITEMDPTAPGYVKLQATPWLFAILRSTEPFLDEYFALAPRLPEVLLDIGFSVVRTGAATGRHLCIVATKGGSIDARPSTEERLASDEHLATFMTKK